jgi:DNA-binding NtrC family response regulator
MNANKFTIVIVDDDASVCRALERLLRASGFHPLINKTIETHRTQIMKK